ncbi:hypothetical protein AB0C74_40265 [Spirillospora sp. NPDC048832]
MVEDDLVDGGYLVPVGVAGHLHGDADGVAVCLRPEGAHVRGGGRDDGEFFVEFSDQGPFFILGRVD